MKKAENVGGQAIYTVQKVVIVETRSNECDDKNFKVWPKEMKT